MSEALPPNPADAGIEVRTHFVRRRNAMVVNASLSDLYVDYYLHLAGQNLKPSPEHDILFKRALAAFVLHAASRPWNELLAWTINFQTPRVNVFLTVDNETGAVTGRVFSEHVRELPENIFFSDVVPRGKPRHRSAVGFSGSDPLAAVEHFQAQSEQRLARLFDMGEEEFVLVLEHPDCDRAWLAGIDPAVAGRLDEEETLALLERRIYRWHCGCDQRRMLEVLAPAMRQDPEGLFGPDPKLEIRCPRCGHRYAITREALEAFVAQ